MALSDKYCISSAYAADFANLMEAGIPASSYLPYGFYETARYLQSTGVNSGIDLPYFMCAL
jgi:hypothetical protein